MTPEKFRGATEEELEYLASLSLALQPKEGPEYGGEGTSEPREEQRTGLEVSV